MPRHHGTVHVANWAAMQHKLGCRGHWAGHDTPPIMARTVILLDDTCPKPPAARQHALAAVVRTRRTGL